MRAIADTCGLFAGPKSPVPKARNLKLAGKVIDEAAEKEFWKKHEKLRKQRAGEAEVCTHLTKSAKVSCRNGWYDNALRMVDEALSICPNTAYLWHMKLDILRRSGGQEAVEAIAKHASNIFPLYDFSEAFIW